MSSKHIIHATAETFHDEVLHSDVPVVVDFWAPWCGPCRAIAPVLEQLADEFGGKVRVAKVNVDDEPGIAQAFAVRGIPTIYAVANGDVVAQQVGFGGVKRLRDLFETLSQRDASLAAG